MLIPELSPQKLPACMSRCQGHHNQTPCYIVLIAAPEKASPTCWQEEVVHFLTRPYISICPLQRPYVKGPLIAEARTPTPQIQKTQCMEPRHPSCSKTLLLPRNLTLGFRVGFWSFGLKNCWGLRYIHL